jgi:hypothetical protein
VKRLITIIVTGALAFMFLLPNSSSAAGIKGGLKIGVSSAKLYGDDVGDFEGLLGEGLKSRIGFCAGGFITFNITEMFAIQPEVLYTMKGVRWEGGINGATPLKIWIKLDYLEIPVLVKIIVPTPGGVKPFLFAGPVLALKLSSKVKAEYAGDSEEEDIEDENMKSTDFGLVIGAGVDFGLGIPGTGKMTLDVRYSLGLSTISAFEGDDVKNGVFSLMVGFSF